jgi:hypothetical protein
MLGKESANTVRKIKSGDYNPPAVVVDAQYKILNEPLRFQHAAVPTVAINPLHFSSRQSLQQSHQ